MSKDLKMIDLNSLPLESLQVQSVMLFEENRADIKTMVTISAKPGVAHFARVMQAVKAKTPHGQWSAWVETTFNGELSLRSVQLMMADEKDPAKAEARKTKDKAAKAAKAQESCAFETNKSDPAPKPPTNRKTAAGSSKGSEDKKPRPQTVVPEIVEDPKEGPTDAVDAYLNVVSPVQVVRDVLTRITDDELRVKEVRRIRKELDKFDPPTRFVKPDGNDVTAFMVTLDESLLQGKDIVQIADEFVDYYAANGWMVGRVAMKDWRAAARKWLRSQGQFSNGKANGNGRQTGNHGGDKISSVERQRRSVAAIAARFGGQTE